MRIIKQALCLNPSRQGRSFQGGDSHHGTGHPGCSLNPSRQGRSFQVEVHLEEPEAYRASLNPSRQGRSFQVFHRGERIYLGMVSQPLPAREVISRPYYDGFYLFKFVSTPPGKGGHFKKKALRQWNIDYKSQPLPAREVISRKTRMINAEYNRMSQPLPAREVISRIRSKRYNVAK